MYFRDRREAGAKLAEALSRYVGQKGVVLGLPRGGVVVGYEIARHLKMPLDVVIVRKIGAPENPEYALGAVAENGEVLLDHEAVRMFGVPRSYLQREIDRQKEEIERRKQLYRGGRSLRPLAGLLVIVVDDGIATGFTMKASLRAIRAEGPRKLVMAVPVAPPESFKSLEAEADEAICLHQPYPFFAVGQFYRDFAQVTDEEVIALLSDQPWLEGVP